MNRFLNATMATVAFGLALSGSAFAGAPAQDSASATTRPWHCVYQSSDGGLWEFVQQERCPLVRNDPDFGAMILMAAYQA